MLKRLCFVFKTAFAAIGNVQTVGGIMGWLGISAASIISALTAYWGDLSPLFVFLIALAVFCLTLLIAVLRQAYKLNDACTLTATYDIPVMDALWYIYEGKWPKKTIRPSDVPETATKDFLSGLGKLRQWAYEDKITMWGSQTRNPLVERIDRSYWEDHDFFEPMKIFHDNTLGIITATAPNRMPGNPKTYLNLMANKSEIVEACQSENT